MPEVYWSTVKRRFYAPYFSWAFVVYFLGEFVKFIVPALVAYYTHHWWAQEATLVAKPNVYHTQNFIFGLDVMEYDGATYYGTTLGYSSYAEYNARLETYFRSAKVMSYREDIDRDGRSDFLHFEAEFQLFAEEKVHGVRAWYEVSYQLNERLEIDMIAPVYVAYSGGVPGYQFYFDGDLRFKQRQGIQATLTRNDYNSTLLTTEVLQSAQHCTWDKITELYRERNDTLAFEGDHVWAPGATREFVIKGRMRIPEEHYIYVPGFWETLKFGLVQYIALHFAFTLITELFQQFVFHQQVVEARMVSEVPKAHRM